MATWDDVRRIALSLPETTEEPGPVWKVRGKAFVIERPLRRGDLEHLGARAPDLPPLGAWVPDLGVKEALLESAPEVYFTTPHFNGYPMVLVRLDAVDPLELYELATDAWLSRAPKTLVKAYLAELPAAEDS